MVERLMPPAYILESAFILHVNGSNRHILERVTDMTPFKQNILGD